LRAVIQRVTRAQVRVDGETVGRIGRGFLILLGVAHGDTEEQARVLARKTARTALLPTWAPPPPRRTVDCLCAHRRAG